MNSLSRTTNNNGALTLRDAMNRLFEDSFVHPFSLAGSRSPLMDVYETNETFYVKLAVPGLKPENFDISIEQNTLTVRGAIADDQKQEGSYLLREQSWGDFARSVQFPTPVKAESIEASLADGILSIQVPKAEHARPRKITIRTA